MEESFEKKPYRKPMDPKVKQMLNEKKKKRKQELLELRKIVEEQKKEKEIPAPTPKTRAPRVDKYAEMATKLQNLESMLVNQSQSLYELKVRKQIKDQLKNEKKELTSEKNKVVDLDEAKEVKEEIKTVEKKMQRADFSNLFY
ncbi:MAG: hypothetical protein IM318_19410 [Microcystis sp. M017S1]|nr:hypothetical protein [Microcystis sp. M017S1]